MLAEEVALCWLRSNHRGWSRDGVMREKYDATRPGESGGGGEYAPQVCLSLAYHNVRWRPYRGLGCVALHTHTVRTRYGFIRRTASVGPTAWRCGCSNATRRASRASCARTASTVTWLTNSARHAWTYRYRATYCTVLRLVIIPAAPPVCFACSVPKIKPRVNTARYRTGTERRAPGLPYIKSYGLALFLVHFRTPPHSP